MTHSATLRTHETELIYGMGSALDLKTLRKDVKGRQIEWKRHVLERLIERGVSRAQVLEVIEKGEIIEEYDDDKPFPSALILGFVGKRPLHVVVALNTGTAFVITVYEPQSNLFGPDFRDRKKR